MKRIIILIVLSVGFCSVTKAQNTSIKIVAQLNDSLDVLKIQQTINYKNVSNDTLRKFYLYNWANSYKNQKAPLSERLIADYDKSLYFADSTDRGFTEISNLTVDFENVNFKNKDKQIDILEIALNKNIVPKDSIQIRVTYTIKIPNASFTGYGKTKNGYDLRYWYLKPALYWKEWHLDSNLNMDDMLSRPTDYEVKLQVPKTYFVNSNLYQYETEKSNFKEYLLLGKEKSEVILSIKTENNFKSFKTREINVLTDLHQKGVNQRLGSDLLSRQLDFIAQYLGKYPTKQIYLDKATNSKNPIYGLNQLPKFLRAFPLVFEWELTMFKALTKRYIDDTMLLDRRKDYWLTDGLQTYLMMAYVEKYYPEIKLTGNISKIWGLRTFNFAKLGFNDKYPFVYQFSARQFLDQPLTTSSDSLSNFNRKIVSKYKAGLGLRYLSDYVGDSIMKTSIQDFYEQNKYELTTSKEFTKIISKNTEKDLKWFFGDYLNTDKKIDYTIKKVSQKNDSVYVTIKNKRNITAPVALYGVKNWNIKFKKWFPNIDDTATVAVPKGDFDRLSLNYENSYPEFNSMDNWKKIGKKFLNKPVRFKLYKDINDPYYNQLYIQPNIKYNFYDGVLLGMKIHNRPILARNLSFTISPLYGTKSNALNGGAGVSYSQYFENAKVNKIIYGVSGSNLHYAPDLSYETFNQSVTVQFRRKNLREAGNNFISARLLNINKELPQGVVQTDEDKYSVFQLRYYYNKPDIIQEFQYGFEFEKGSQFSKVSGVVQYRKLTAKNRRLDFRAYAGVFLDNNTTSDYFSFGLDRANDYLFQLNYIGRSESSGIFSQQFILAEGGFKSVFSQRFANQFLVSFNSSIGLWKWIEFYNDVAFLKNRGRNLFFAYENGIRFNFITDILEFYFPLYTNNGWELSAPAYSQKIRLVLQLDPKRIFNFFRRGFL